MRRLLSLLPVLALLLAPIGGVLAQAADRWPALVVRVVDGDTVDVQWEDGSADRLRLIGLNTPETVDPRRAVQCYGQQASDRAHELLDAQTVVVELDASQGDRDRYGRVLAYVFLPDGSNFAEVMIAGGYGAEYTYRTPYRYVEAFKAAQAYAREHQFGLWAPNACGAPDPLQTPSVPIHAMPTAVAVGSGIPEVPEYSGPFDPNGLDRDCKDFGTWEEAQAFYIAAGGPQRDPHRLDADHDGTACESLAGAPAGEGDHDY